MITQLLTELEAVEKTAITAMRVAETAFKAAAAAGKPLEQIMALDPGRHQIALGAVRTAIEQVQSIMGAAADAEETAGTKNAS
jgi:hypothetical protein